MGNPNIHYPGDAPTPCWSCEHFAGLRTCSTIEPLVPAGFYFSRYILCNRDVPWPSVGNPDTGCRFWSTDPLNRAQRSPSQE